MTGSTNSTMRRQDRRLVAALLCLAAGGWLACGGEESEPPQATETVEMDRIPIIDVHAHVFNLRYLPVKGILYRFRIPDPLAEELANHLTDMTARYDTPTTESLSAIDLEELSEAELRERLERRLGSGEAEAEAVGDDSRQLPFLSDRAQELLYDYVIDEIRHEEEARTQLESAAPEDDPVGPDLDDEAILSDFLLARDEGIEAVGAESREEIIRAAPPFDLILGVLKKVLRVAGSPARFYRMLDVLLRSEAGIVSYLQNTEHPQVKTFVHHMMRLDAVYNDGLTVPVEEQIRRSGLLKESSSGTFLFFVAYDPFQLDPGFADIESAVEAGATGLKFYPPSGYRPNDTIIPEPPDPWFILPSVKDRIREQHASRYDAIKSDEAVSAWSPVIPGYADLPEEKALDAINRLAFDKAREEGLVIFSHHTNSGFEAWKDYGRDMAAPCYWWDVLEKNETTKLILAHSGGGWGWFGKNKRWKRSFARQAFNMCVTFDNVYCDFGYMDEVLDKNGPEKLQTRLLELAGTDPVTAEEQEALGFDDCVGRQLPRKHDILSKIVYGSDWMMSVRAANHRSFVDDFAKVFSGDELGPWRDEFFCRNAARILGLEQATCDPLPALE